MREYKFRGKAIMPIGELDKLGIKHDNGWVYGNLIITGNEAWIVGSIIEWDDEYIAHEWWCQVDRNTIGQYTGLKDKHGQEIYEGDVLLNTYKPMLKNIFSDRQVYVIEYQYKGFRFKPLFKELACKYEIEEDMKVIGNIYENPELLE